MQPLRTTRGRSLVLDRPVVMGILNVTPDSFSDGGRLLSGGTPDADLILERARQMLADGARILDVGGESTRPGATPIGPQQELERVLPAVQRLTAEFDAVISVDTSTPEVMRACIAAGATLVNDVRALERPGALEAVAEGGAHACLMHMRGEPGNMQQQTGYADVVAEVSAYLASRAATCEAAGIPRGRLLLDPGFGFAKTPEQNLALLHRLGALRAQGLPLLVGLSRKSLIGAVLGRTVEERLAGSLALAVLAVAGGAAIVRTHDVRETVDAVRMADAVMRESLQ